MNPYLASRQLNTKYYYLVSRMYQVTAQGTRGCHLGDNTLASAENLACSSYRKLVGLKNRQLHFPKTWE